MAAIAAAATEQRKKLQKISFKVVTSRHFFAGAFTKIAQVCIRGILFRDHTTIRCSRAWGYCRSSSSSPSSIHLLLLYNPFLLIAEYF